MSISFHPNPGTVLICNYAGLNEPEMVKTRPVVIVSPRSRRHELVTVVPLSTTAPEVVLPWHYQLHLTQPLALNWPEIVLWAKCDMINTFSITRLNRFHVQVPYGARKYYDRRINPEDLQAIKNCVRLFLGL